MGNAVDPTGLSFTVTKIDGTTASVSPQTLTPTTWGDTVGTQTCTFTYSDGYDSVSCDVEANVLAETIVITSLEVTGKPTAPQVNGGSPSFTGMTFTFGLSNEQSVVKTGAEIDADLAESGDHYVTWTSEELDPATGEWDTGSQGYADCTFTVGNKWTSEDYEIASPAPSDVVTIYMHEPVSIAITNVVASKSMINTTHPAGEPDQWTEMSGSDVTVAVTFADGDVETADPQDLDFPVEPDFASGNPNNLGNYNFTVRYRNNVNLTANGTIKGTRPDGQTMDVRATDAGLSDYRPGCNGLIYHDFPEATWNAIKADGTGLKGMAAIYDPSIPQVQEGEWVCVSIRKDHYDNDTPVDYATFGGYISDYGVVTTSSGTANTPGYKPGWGSLFDGNDLSACNISLQIDGTGTETSSFATVYTIIGKAKKTFNAPDSVKKSDIDTTVTGALIYSDKIGPVDFS